MSIVPRMQRLGCFVEPLHDFACRRNGSSQRRCGAAQDENTRYVCIGPVNKVINMLCCWLEDPNSEAFKRCGQS